MLFIVSFSVVTTFSNQHFRCFLLKYLEYSHQISAQKSEKYDLTFGTKIRVSLKKKIEGMMLSIMPGMI